MDEPESGLSALQRLAPLIGVVLSAPMEGRVEIGDDPCVSVWSYDTGADDPNSAPFICVGEVRVRGGSFVSDLLRRPIPVDDPEAAAWGIAYDLVRQGW